METDVANFRANTRLWLIGSFAGWLTLLTMPIGLGVLIFLIKWLKNVGTHYKLTDQRLIINTGILLKRIDEIELYRVKDVTVDFSLLNQMVDIGTVSLRSSDATTRGRPFQLVGVPQARDLRSSCGPWSTKPGEDAVFLSWTLIVTRFAKVWGWK